MDHTCNLKSRQIKAARSLLDWSQEDLAAATSLSVATIRKLEAGNISPRGKTQRALQNAFENAGLEFLEPDGVRHRPEEIRVFQDIEGVKRFYDDVYLSLSRSGGSIATVAPDPNLLWDIMGDYADFHRKRMETIGDIISVRCLITERVKKFPAPSYCEYRILSKSYVNPTPFYIYADKCGIRTIGSESHPKIVVIQSRLVAESFLNQFDSMWDKATYLEGRKRK
ncbi:MAG: helix-turn-helix transcriptional regulator [Bdellovibrionales bacterium]